MNNLDRQYIDLLGDILENGVKKNDRTGTGTYSVFGRTLRFDLSEGFPLLTTKKIHHKAVFHELIWFLQGGDNIKYLVDNDVRIWNEWPYKRYIEHEEAEVNKMRDEGIFVEYQRTTMQDFIEKIKSDDEFAAEWGKLGPVYGKQWRYWLGGTDDGEPVYLDQISDIVGLLKNNPDSRRILVSAWNPAEVADMLLPPCHYAFQLWTKELTAKEREDIYHSSGKPIKLVAHIMSDSTDVQHDKQVNSHIHQFLDGEGIPRRSVSLMFQMRSVDVMLGWPFDIASYGGLLHILAHCTDMQPGELIINSADTHIYLNHVEQVKLQMTRTPYKLPKLSIAATTKNINEIRFEDLVITDYECHPAIKAEVAV
jgi:thymidylate synthase